MYEAQTMRKTNNVWQMIHLWMFEIYNEAFIPQQLPSGASWGIQRCKEWCRSKFDLPHSTKSMKVNISIQNLNNKNDIKPDYER